MPLVLDAPEFLAHPSRNKRSEIQGVITIAREVITSLIDDLDGSAAAEEVQFSLDSVTYTIDLSEKNAAKLRNALAPYIEGARKAAPEGRGGRRMKIVRGPAQRESDRERNQLIREWAVSEGVELPTRGRIAQAVLNAYDDGNGDALREALGLELVEEDKPKRRRKTEAEFSEAAA